MKQYILPMFALTATAMLLPSCSNDDIDIQTGDATVTLSATLPESLQTRTFGDGLKAKNLQMVVLEADDKGIVGENLPVFDGAKTVYTTTFAENSLTTNVPVKLVTGKKYAVICWSDAGEDSPYTYNAEKHTVDAKYDGFKTSDDNLDAFYAYQTFTVEGDGTQTIQLRRPFAQLNIGTDDYEVASKAGFTAAQTEVTVPVSNHLDLVKGEVNDPVPTKFIAADLPKGETFPTSAGTYKYLSMNYVLTGADKSLVDVNLTVTGNGAPISHTFNTVPVQRNYRTNIYGSILTNAVNVQVEIVPDFDGEGYNYDATKLVRDLAAGSDITLPTDVEMRSTGFVGEGTTSTLDLNGKTIFNTNEVWDNKTTIDGVTEENWSLLSAKTGTLTVNGDGMVKAKANDCYAADVRDGGKLIINGGHFVGNIHAVYVYEGELEVNGGTFEVIQKYPDAAKADEFVLNCYDKNRADGTAKITVKGGKFINFNPADCWAEGEHTNFVADGYTSVLVSTSPVTYEVRPVSAESTVSDATDLTDLMKNSGGLLVVDSHLSTGQTFSVMKPVDLILNEGAVLASDNKNINFMNTLAVNSDMTITGNGGKIIGPTMPEQGSTAAISMGNRNAAGHCCIYGNVTVDGGSGSGGENYAVKVYNGKLEIYGGTFRTGTSISNGKNAVIYLTANQNIFSAECYIYGGVFECEGDASRMLDIRENCKGTNTLKVYGGTFVGFNPADKNYVADGYKSVETTYKDKKAWTVVKE